MSSKKQSALIVVVLACIIVLLWWWRVRPDSVAEKPAPVQSAPQDVPEGTAAARVTKTPPATPSPSPTEKPNSELRRAFETLNHNEIEFYGRAVDQFGGPVPTAAVEGVVLVNTGIRGGQMRRQTTTDAQGYFQFGGFKGQDLGITIAKEGYEYRRQNSSFSYSYFEADHKRHNPDPRNPVVFVLWKKQGGEALVHYSKMFWDISAEGTPVKIDLATGEMNATKADLIVTLERSPVKMRQGQRGYYWKVSLEVVGGGLIDAGEKDYYNIAPEAGYESRFEYAQNPQSIRDAQEGKITWSWQDRTSAVLFIKSLNGDRYALVRLTVISSGRIDNDTTGSLGMSVWLNPSGSRNLEFDPAKAIKPKH